jgi:hypothetical protein
MEENSFMASQDKDRDEDQDKDKQAAELLRRSLAAPTGAPGSEIDACPDPEILAAYSERSLDQEEAARLNMHFSQCARCREQLVVLVRARGSASATEEKRPRAPSMVWDWRWLAPAAAAIVFVIVVQVFRPPHRAAEQPLVAINQQPAPLVAPAAASATPESAPNSSAAADSLARISPTLNSAKSEGAPQELARELPEKQPERANAIASPGSRNDAELDKAAKRADAKKSDASALAGNSSTTGRVSVTASVEALAAPVAPPAHEVVQPIPPDISNSTTGGAISAPPAAAPKSARSEHLSAAVATNRSFAQTESVAVQAGDETSAQTLVRTPDPQMLWRFSGGRYVERSSDAGATWRVQWTSPNAHLVAGAAPTADTCWLVGRDAMILVTTDGKKWKTIDPPADADFAGVSATDASSATVTSTDGRKFMTSDSGKHWTPAP